MDQSTALKHIGYAIAFLIGTVNLPHEAFAILAALMIMDTASGIVRAGVLHGWRAVRSTRLTAGVLSKLFIVTVPLVIAWAGKGAGLNLIPIAQGALSMIILAEAYSILGNIHAIRIRKDIKEFDAIAAALEFARKAVERILQESLKGKDNDKQKK